MADTPARGTAGLWLHAIPLFALPQIGVYGWLPVELQVVMVASALAYRYCWHPAHSPGPVWHGRPGSGGAYRLAGAGAPLSSRVQPP